MLLCFRQSHLKTPGNTQWPLKPCLPKSLPLPLPLGTGTVSDHPSLLSFICAICSRVKSQVIYTYPPLSCPCPWQLWGGSMEIPCSGDRGLQEDPAEEGDVCDSQTVQNLLSASGGAGGVQHTWEMHSTFTYHTVAVILHKHSIAPSLITH